MRSALNIARRGLGNVAPNPAVGCIIVKNDVVIGRGWTQKRGRPHAETVALEQAGLQAKGATAYVTLEPCSHQGQTPPCAQALVDAGIKRCVIACEDPDLRVSGAGIQMLKNAGIDVSLGVLEIEAKVINQGFFHSIKNDRPFVTLKVASSFDQKITAQKGQRTQITGELSLKRAHLERSKHDAILVGIETALIDDPLLSCRIQGYEHIMIRILLDSHLRVTEEAKMVQKISNDPLWIFHASKEEKKVRMLENKAVRLFENSNMNVSDILETLAQNGVTRLLVEGGSKIYQSFLDAGSVDQILWFKAPQTIGPQGLDILPGARWEKQLKQLESFELENSVPLGQDQLEIWTKAG